MGDPTLLLVAPSDDQVVPKPLNDWIGFSQFISPSYWINYCIAAAFDYNPLELVEKTVAGDWNAAAQAGRAFEILGDYCDEMAAQLHMGSTTAAADWDGQAADAAHTYFTGLSTAIKDQADALRAAGGEYLSVSAGMQQTGVLMDSLLRQAMDWLIIAAAAAAATAATAAVTAGAGLLVGGGAVAASIARVAALAKQILAAHDLAVNMCNGSVGLIAGYLGALRDFETTTLPASYDNKVIS